MGRNERRSAIGPCCIEPDHFDFPSRFRLDSSGFATAAHLCIRNQFVTLGGWERDEHAPGRSSVDSVSPFTVPLNVEGVRIPRAMRPPSRAPPSRKRYPGWLCRRSLIPNIEKANSPSLFPSPLSFPSFLPHLPAKMRAFSALSAVLFFAASTLALTVTTPAQGASWDASKQSQSVAWNAVGTDPSNFSIALVNMVRLRRISAQLEVVLTHCPHYLRCSVPCSNRTRLSTSF